MRLASTLFGIAAAFAIAACGSGPAPNTGPEVQRPSKPSEAPPAVAKADAGPAPDDWASTVLAAVKGYREWKRIGDFPRWAPTMCDVPRQNIPIYSEADAGPHSRKLYFLYVRDAAAYATPTKMQPTGQVLVKEGYAPEAAGTDENGATQFRCGKRTDLFIMLKTGKEEGTDAGWIYAVVSPDGTRVDHAGMLESCMRCHQDAGPSRMFGVKSAAIGETRKPTVVSGPER